MSQTPRAFALQEITACWDQGYEALARGDLERLQVLVDIAAEHLADVGDGAGDSAVESQLRNEAISARGRLEHGMRAGLDGMHDELSRTRVGTKLLRGYSNASRRLGSKLEKSI